MLVRWCVLALCFLASACEKDNGIKRAPAPVGAVQHIEPTPTAAAVPTAVTERAAPVSESDGECLPGKLDEGRNTAQLAERDIPAKGSPYRDSAFAACVVRATDYRQEGIEGFARNDYSRRQAFNADSSRFIVVAGNGVWYQYATATLANLGPLRPLSGDAEPQWHPTDPHTLYYGFRNGGLRIMQLDVRTGRSSIAADLRGKLPWPKAARAWTKAEGSPSRDARYWGLQVETENFDILGYAIWDMQEQRLVGHKPVATRPDHVSMSPSGRWFVSSGEGGTIAWSHDFGTRRQLHKRSEHSDLAIGEQGHDYYVSIDYQSNEGFIFMVDLDTGARTDLIRTYLSGTATALHVSGKAYDKPGWVLVSTYAPQGPARWFSDRLFAMELKANPRVYQLAAHRSTVKDNYFAEPHASVNRDFTRILFNSNWNVSDKQGVDAYLVTLSPQAFP